MRRAAATALWLSWSVAVVAALVMLERGILFISLCALAIPFAVLMACQVPLPVVRWHS
jgi:hypothetical protein